MAKITVQQPAALLHAPPCSRGVLPLSRTQLLDRDHVRHARLDDLAGGTIEAHAQWRGAVAQRNGHRSAAAVVGEADELRALVHFVLPARWQGPRERDVVETEPAHERSIRDRDAA